MKNTHLLEVTDLQIKIQLKNSGNLLAYASILVPTKDWGDLVIKGISIWKSDYEDVRLGANVNIEAPHYKRFKGKFYYAYFEDKLMWQQIEKLIYAEYKKAIAISENVSSFSDIMMDLDSSPL